MYFLEHLHQVYPKIWNSQIYPKSKQICNSDSAVGIIRKRLNAAHKAEVRFANSHYL